MVTQLEVGDRVQTRAQSYVPAGALGRVHMKLVSKDALPHVCYA